MKMMIVLAVLVAVACAAPADPKPVLILKSASEFDPDQGKYSYSFESEDGVKIEESGFQKQVGEKPEDIGTVARGSYSYVDPEGRTLTVTWIADENGFQPSGAHLPVAARR